MASRSTKLVTRNRHKQALPFRENREEEEELCYLLESKAVDLEARYSYGFDPILTAENVVPRACAAYYLEMTENHIPNTFLKKTLDFFEHRVLKSWNESIKALGSSLDVVTEAVQLGLVNACMDSIVGKALADPRLLGKPYVEGDGVEGNKCNGTNTRRRLFDSWREEEEDLTVLSLQFYEPIMSALIEREAPSQYVASSLYRYFKKWGYWCTGAGEEGLPSSSSSVYHNTASSQRQVIEAVERLLSDERGLVPCKFLLEILRSAVALQASSDCRNGLEIRIGKQLNEATVDDLLMPCQVNANETVNLQYDGECVRRIVRNFYADCAVVVDEDYNMSRLSAVADLVEELLAKVASDVDLKRESFMSLAETSVAISNGSRRRSDGIYRAIDVYLDSHRYLTETEREEVCQVLDCHKMSMAACEHAAQNDRLPLRVMVQVLLVGQLHLRETIVNEVQGSDKWLRKEEEREVTEGNREQVRIEMENMEYKVMELERECSVMRREIERGSGGGGGCVVKKEKQKRKQSTGGMWRELKRKFGCISMNDCDCNVKIKKKVHPRN